MKIAVLAGGRSPEHDVSVRSGHRVLTALQELGHDAFAIDPAQSSLAVTLQERAPDLCYLALHGKEGEDGTVQRLLDLLDIPYTGTAAFECELAFDKILAKEAMGRAGVSTPAWVAIEGAALRDLGAGAALGKAIERVGIPCVVKPSRSGSALGLSFVEREADLPAAVMGAMSFSGAAVVESRIEGTEVAVGLAGEPLEAMPLVEIVPKDGVYGYSARYTAGATEYFAPARVDAGVASACTEEAVRAARTLGLRDVTRVDAMVDRAGNAWILEVNACPGMTETSLLPMGARAAGMSLARLCDVILQSAAGRR